MTESEKWRLAAKVIAVAALLLYATSTFSLTEDVEHYGLPFSFYEKSYWSGQEKFYWQPLAADAVVWIFVAAGIVGIWEGFREAVTGKKTQSWKKKEKI